MTDLPSQMPVNPALIKATHQDPFEQDEASLTLAQIIPRIIKERGSILNVTEESLRQEIAELDQQLGEENPEVSMDFGEEQDGNAGVEPEGIRAGDAMSTDEFVKEKAEILQLLRSALNESSLSLDFVSLLISCVRPAAGSISMSPHLKQHVPTGTLNSALVEIPEAEKEARREAYEKEAKVGQGWKLKSLEYSSDLFKSSSAWLTGESLKEREYWNQICNIVKSREVLIKIGRDIGVKYGFGDSGSTYFDKGVGILKKDVSNGDVQFNPIRNNNLERSNKIVRVKISKRVDDELKVISETDVKKLFQEAVSNDDESIGSEISRARFYLFEEELFHELVREATTLVSYQVQVINNRIVVEINDEIIEIEAVSPSDCNTDEMDESTDSAKADYISSFLRLMLCHEHKQNVSARFKTPRPKLDPRYQSKSETNRTALLLRPLIGHSRHNHYIKAVRKICESLVEKFYPEDGKDRASISIIKHDNITLKELKRDKFTRCTKIPRSTVKFQIDSVKDKSKRLNFEITIANTSSFCNILLNVKTFWLGQDKKLVDVSFSEFIDVEDSLHWAIKSY